MRIHKSIAIGAAAIALSACEMSPPIESEVFEISDGTAKQVSGVQYALPLARIQVQISKAQDQTVTLGLTRVSYPDPNARYLAQANFSAFANDKIQLGVTDNGLLNLTVADSEEVSDDIVTTVVDQLRSAGPEAIKTNSNQTSARSALINPYASGGLPGWVELEWLGEKPDEKLALTRKKCPEGASICVPVMVPVLVRAKVASGVKLEGIIAVPHPYESIGVALHRRPCTKTVNTISISNGILTKYDVDKPSEAAGCLSIPLKVITAIVSAPVDAFKRDQAILTAQKEALVAQKAALDAQIALDLALANANKPPEEE